MASKVSKKKTLISPSIIWLLFVLVLLVLLSIVGTLTVMGVFDRSSGVPIHSIVQAEDICSERVHKDYGSKMNVLTVDDRSSHHDISGNVYKMFYEIEVSRDSSRQSGVEAFYVNCLVSGDEGTIDSMQYFESKNLGPKANRRSYGNAFGL